MELVVNSINKTIRGKVILSDVNLCLKRGNVYGFIGKNGSGKTGIVWVDESRFR